MKNGQTKSSGDDDLFVNALARGRHTEICLNKDAFTYSEAKPTWGGWIRQKTRHVSTASHYKLLHKFVLFLFALSNFLFYTSFAVLCIKGFMQPIMLLSVLSFALALFTKYMVTAAINNKLQQSDLSKWLIVMDPLYVLYLLLIFILSIFRPNPEWK
jgi:hypothetical protein